MSGLIVNELLLFDQYFVHSKDAYIQSCLVIFIVRIWWYKPTLLA